MGPVVRRVRRGELDVYLVQVLLQLEVVRAAPRLFLAVVREALRAIELKHVLLRLVVEERRDRVVRPVRSLVVGTKMPQVNLVAADRSFVLLTYLAYLQEAAVFILSETLMLLLLFGSVLLLW